MAMRRMSQDYICTWLTLGALLIAVLLAIGSEPPPLPSAPAPKTVSVTLAVAENVKRRMEQLDFNIQQKLVNPEIGRRLGTRPAVVG